MRTNEGNGRVIREGRQMGNRREGVMGGRREVEAMNGARDRSKVNQREREKLGVEAIYHLECGSPFVFLFQTPSWNVYGVGTVVLEWLVAL